MFRRTTAILTFAAMALAEQPVAEPIAAQVAEHRKLVSCPDATLDISLSNYDVKPGRKIRATCSIDFSDFPPEDNVVFGLSSDSELNFYSPKISPSIKGSTSKYKYESDIDFVWWQFNSDYADYYIKRGTYTATVTYQIPKDADPNTDGPYTITCYSYDSLMNECDSVSAVLH